MTDKVYATYKRAASEHGSDLPDFMTMLATVLDQIWPPQSPRT